MVRARGGNGRWIAIGLLLFAAGCSSDNTGPAAITVTLRLCGFPTLPGPKACPATSGAPLGAVEVTADATPTGGATVDQIVIHADDLIARADTFVRQSHGTAGGTAVDTIYLPAAVGSITFSATALGHGATGTSAPVVFSVVDTIPPVVTGVTVAPADSVEPGDSVFVDVTATDNAGIARVVVLGSGALAGAADTLNQGGPSVSVRARFRVPPGSAYGTPVSFTVQAFDFGSLSSTLVPSTRLVLGDFTAPTISGGFANGTISDPLVPGDTMRGVVEAADNHKLAWIGYRVGQPVVGQDSVAVTGTAGQFAFSGIVTQAWIGTLPLTLFARDSSGNLATFGLVERVLDAVRKPVRSATGQGGIYDYAFDAKRDALYVMHAFSIDVLPLATMIYGMPITTPTEVRGGHLDLTPSVDSLEFANQVVTDSVFVVLATVDLTQTTRSVQTVHVARAVNANNNPVETGVVASNRVFIPIIDGSGGGELDEFALATQTQTRRSDAGESGNLPTFTLLLPSGDRQQMAVIWNNLGQIYSVNGNAFSAPVTLPSSNLATGAASADQAGTHYLLGGTLLDGSLASVRTFDYPSNPAFPNTAIVSALSPDGTIAYFSQTVDNSNRGLVVVVRVSDGVVLQHILTPTILGRLLALPDGVRLVGFAPDNTVFVVDLP